MEYGQRCPLSVIYSTAAGLAIQGNTNNIGYTLKELNPSAVAGVYGTLAHAAFIMGMVASIDYNRIAGTITTAFKSQSGLAFTATDADTANALKAKGFNFYGSYAENNAQFRFFYPGSMYGTYKWIDMYVNAIWLNASIQLAQMTLLTNVGRLPYNDGGYAQVLAAAQGVFDTALSSGVIDRGITLSPSQRAQVNREAGRDIAGILEAEGYFMQVIDPAAAERAERETPEISLWYTYGGAIQRMVIASTAIE
jgi:hypothetical protein